MRNLMINEVNCVSGGEDDVIDLVSSFSVNYIYSVKENDPIAPFKVSSNIESIELVSAFPEEDDIV